MVVSINGWVFVVLKWDTFRSLTKVFGELTWASFLFIFYFSLSFSKYYELLVYNHVCTSQQWRWK